MFTSSAKEDSSYVEKYLPPLDSFMDRKDSKLQKHLRSRRVLHPPEASPQPIVEG